MLEPETVEIIRALSGCVDELARALEDICSGLENAPNVEPIMLAALSLTNTARKHIAHA